MKLPQFQIDHYEDCDSRCNRPNRWNLGFHFAYWRNVGEKVFVDIFCFRPSSSSTSSWLGTLSDSFGKRILFSRPSSLHYFIFAKPLRCAVQTSWPISLTLLSLWQNVTFSGFTFFFPFFPFSPLSKSHLKSQSRAAEQPPWRARCSALLSRLQTTEARGHVSSTS